MTVCLYFSDLTAFGSDMNVMRSSFIAGRLFLDVIDLTEIGEFQTEPESDISSGISLVAEHGVILRLWPGGVTLITKCLCNPPPSVNTFPFIVDVNCFPVIFVSGSFFFSKTIIIIYNDLFKMEKETRREILPVFLFLYKLNIWEHKRQNHLLISVAVEHLAFWTLSLSRY